MSVIHSLRAEESPLLQSFKTFFPLENILKVECLNTHHLFQILTKEGTYLAHDCSNLSKEKFKTVKNLTETAGKESLGLRLAAEDEQQQILFLTLFENGSGITLSPWPSIERKERYIYFRAVDKLFFLHESRKTWKRLGEKKIAPLGTIDNFEILSSHPANLITARNKVKSVFQAQKTNFEKNLVFCHGDYTKETVLVYVMGNLPTITSFDKCTFSHPYFDLACFTSPLKEQDEQALFDYYCDLQDEWVGKPLSYSAQVAKEKERRLLFKVMKIGILMVEALNLVTRNLPAEASINKIILLTAALE